MVVIVNCDGNFGFTFEISSRASFVHLVYIYCLPSISPVLEISTCLLLGFYRQGELKNHHLQYVGVGTTDGGDSHRQSPGLVVIKS